MNDREPDLRGGDERLADWVDGRMSDRDRERFLAEMRVNAQLKKDLENYERTVGVVRSALRAPMQPAPIADRVMAAIAAEKAKPEPVRSAPLSFRSRPLWWSLLSAAALLLVALLVNELPSPPATTSDLVSHDASRPQPVTAATVPAGQPADAENPELASKQSGAKPGEMKKSLATDAGPGSDPTPGVSDKPEGARRNREGEVTRSEPDGAASQDRADAKTAAAPSTAVQREALGKERRFGSESQPATEQSLGAEPAAQARVGAAVQTPIANPPAEPGQADQRTNEGDPRAPFTRGAASGTGDKPVGTFADGPAAADKTKPAAGGGGGAVADPQGAVAGPGSPGAELPKRVPGSETWGDLGSTNTEEYKNKDRATGEKAAPSPVNGRGGGRRGAQTPAGQALAMVLVEGLIEPTEVPGKAALEKSKESEATSADEPRDRATNPNAFRIVDAAPLDEAGLRAAVRGFLHSAAVGGAEAVTAAFPTARGTVAVSPLLDTSIEFDAPAGSKFGATADKLAFDRTWVVEGARGEVAIVLQEISMWSQERKFTLRSGESKPTTALAAPPTSATGNSRPRPAGPAAGGPTTGGPATGAPTGPSAPAPSATPAQKPLTTGGLLEQKLAERAQVVFRVRLHGR